MKDKLEVGMYCFNKTNRKLGIGEIISFQSNNNVNVKYKNDIELVSIGNVIASHNIIDLIEVGDYVNGCYVSNRRASVNEHLGGHPKGIGIIKCNAYFNQGNYDDCKFVWIKEKDIKSIVTKEQFSQMEYKIGD